MTTVNTSIDYLRAASATSGTTTTGTSGTTDTGTGASTSGTSGGSTGTSSAPSVTGGDQNTQVHGGSNGS